MTYFISGQGLKLVILENHDIEQIKKGHALMVPDDRTIVGWTPDPSWLWEQIQASDCSLLRVGELVDEASKRPEKPRDDPEDNRVVIIRRS